MRTTAQMRINLGIRRRLAPLLENDRRKIELMNALLFSLPGTPVIYYGDEIGMGDNIYLGDRNGVRTPMQWSADRNAGFSQANPQQLYLPVIIDPEYHYEAINVEAQQNNPHSLLWWMKRMIAQRKQFKAFGRGTLEFLHPANRKVLAFVRQYEDERILVVANLSRFAQGVELDLSKHQGTVPVEVFGRNHFPAVSEQPYFLSLGPFGFQWFHLQPKETGQDLLTTGTGTEDLPVLEAESPDDVFAYGSSNGVIRLIPKPLKTRPWFLGRTRNIRDVTINDRVQLPETSSYLMFTDIEYTDGDPDTYLIGLSLASGEKAETILRDSREGVLARVVGMKEEPTIVYSVVFDREFSDALLKSIVRRKRFKGDNGEIQGGHTKAFRKDWERTKTRSNLEPSRLQSDRPNSYIRYGENFILKLYRRLEAGPNPDREMLEFLTEHTEFCNTPRALGWLEYKQSFDETELKTTIGLLTSFTRNGSNGWTHMLDQLGLFFERALAIPAEDPRLKELAVEGDLLSLVSQPIPALMLDLLGTKVEGIRLLGQRAAEMHAALSSRPDIPEFAPEPFTDFYRMGVYHGMIGHVGRTFDALRNRLTKMSGPAQAEIRLLVDQEHVMRGQLHPLRDERITSTRIRIHGRLPSEPSAVHRKRRGVHGLRRCGGSSAERAEDQTIGTARRGRNDPVVQLCVLRGAVWAGTRHCGRTRNQAATADVGGSMESMDQRHLSKGIYGSGRRGGLCTVEPEREANPVTGLPYREVPAGDQP